MWGFLCCFFFFFFQAEDGIRDYKVTGVQTCALPIWVFPTFTADLEEMARWLLSCGITTVAMESTGVYWIPLYDVLERHGVTPCLVNARNMKNVPGRRTDWHECQWLQFLHSVGVLRAAFRPDCDVSAVRSLMRHRTDLVQIAAQHIGPGRSLMPILSWDKAGHAASLLVKHAKIADADESTNPPRDQRNHRRDWFSDCRRHPAGGARSGGAGQTARPLTRGVDARSPLTTGEDARVTLSEDKDASSSSLRARR